MTTVTDNMLMDIDTMLQTIDKALEEIAPHPTVEDEWCYNYFQEVIWEWHHPNREMLLWIDDRNRWAKEAAQFYNEMENDNTAFEREWGSLMNEAIDDFEMLFGMQASRYNMKVILLTALVDHFNKLCPTTIIRTQVN
jgi:hypothetical protein